MDFDSPSQALFFAIAFIDHPGVHGDFERQIENAIERGADLDGASEDGETPLTSAILGGAGSPSAVSILLRLGADPNKRDNNGWTPWGACMSRMTDRVVKEEMSIIKALLEDCHADRSDEEPLDFQKAIVDGDIDAVTSYLDKGINFSSPIIDPLGCAVSNDHLEIAKALLMAGVGVDGREGDDESPLIHAASKGYESMVELLLDHGADIDGYAWDDKNWTAEFCARNNGYEALADCLLVRMSARANTEKTDPKYRMLYEKNTNGINCGLTTEDVVEHLKRWDRTYAISISDVEHDGLVVTFGELPADLNELAKDIYEFCPDVIEQGFGCMDDMLQMAEETGQSINSELMKLLDGIDFSKEDFGLEILQWDLRDNKLVRLWWD